MAHRILCVDDDPLSLAAMARTLSSMDGVVVDTAAGPDEARHLLRVADHSAVVTDHHMPDGTGVELLAGLGQERPELPGILVTGHAEIELALAAVNHGHVFGLLHKPWHPQELRLVVRQALDRFELSRSLRSKVVELERANRQLEHANQMLATSHLESRRLAELAATDEKTGVRSYRFFADRLAQEVARAIRYEHPLTVALVDLDGFKQVNDRHGHVAGDAVLHDVAQLLSRRLRVMDILARFGGDEFAMILPDTDITGARSLSERLRGEVSRTVFGPAGAGEITLSMGLAAIPDQEVGTASELVELADGALYHAKETGRNRYAVAPKTTPTVN